MNTPKAQRDLQSTPKRIPQNSNKFLSKDLPKEPQDLLAFQKLLNKTPPPSALAFQKLLKKLHLLQL